MSAFRVIEPKGIRVPVILSIPHCGALIPEELAVAPDDTDWFVDKLYAFASDLGIATIASVYSRWVIDLNRDPEDKPLYTDGRIITGLCPLTNFLGERLYKDERTTLTDKDVAHRKELYYWPYHNKLSELITSYKQEFGKVLIWDCHSIRQYVATIYHDKFPDLILGDAEGQSASPAVIESAFASLKSSSFSVSHNFPFKGGYITRHYGKPLESQQVLQLEMSKILYMDDAEMRYDDDRATKVSALLEKTLASLIALLNKTT
jgi:N-formylglutamate deformylase